MPGYEGSSLPEVEGISLRQGLGEYDYWARNPLIVIEKGAATYFI